MTLLRKHDSLPGEHSTDHRQETAQRLLDSSARLSYDPELEIDWDAPLVDGKYGMTRSGAVSTAPTCGNACRRISASPSPSTSREHRRHRDLVRDDPHADARPRSLPARSATPYVQFGLTEIADECRHSIMFARSAQRYGIPSYRPKRWIRETGRLFKAVARGALAYGGTLFAEEILDMMQRDFMRDERVQPITRTVSHVHVVEESRHIRYAREETRSARPGSDVSSGHGSGSTSG